MTLAVYKNKIIPPLLVLIAAVLATFFIINRQQEPDRAVAEERIQQVTVTLAEPGLQRIPIASQGVVESRVQIRLMPEVNGKIVQVADNWVNGGFFHKGEQLLQIEAHQYQNQLARSKANLAQAEGTLTQEKAMAHVAAREWQQRDRNQESSEAARSLALREPQLATAQAQVEAARKEVEAARKSLEKTRITAPFDGIVSHKAVDIGQVISSGQLLAEFYAVDRVEIRVPLTQRQQTLLTLPGLKQGEPVPAEVLYQLDRQPYLFAGQLTRTEGMLDEQTKVLYGVVEVNDPYRIGEDGKKMLPLGAFVQVDISSRELEDIITMPRRFLRPGNRVWTVDEDDRLRLKEVSLLPVRGEQIYIESGLEAGDRVVVSSIVEAREGNKVEAVTEKPD